jgi:hypothetical protein
VNGVATWCPERDSAVETDGASSGVWLCSQSALIQIYMYKKQRKREKEGKSKQLSVRNCRSRPQV